MEDARYNFTMECPKLRNLEFFPVREGETQSVGLRDPEGISDGILFLPPNIFYLVQFLDGQHTRNQIAGEYLKRFGEILMPQWVDKFIADLDEKLFLEDERFEAAKGALLASFRAQPTRPAMFAGKSYEAEPERLKQQVDGFFRPKEGPGSSPSEHAGQALKAIVAPHVEINQAGPIYAWAYKEVREARTPDVFVILGTARGVIETLFACTDKDFETPLGLVKADREFLRHFRAHGGEVFFQDELAHRKDHAIEFQTVFLQHVLGAAKPITIVPVLCSFSHLHFSHPNLLAQGQRVGQFLEAFRKTLAAFGKEVCFVVSGDLAHIGMRYGDPKPPTDFSFHKTMQADLAMLKHAENGDPDAFLQFIQKEDDARRIGLLPPLYTMLKLVGDPSGGAPKGSVLRYDRATVDQYNSTVTFAAMAFY
ncbi:MAG: AmmeMemoRadiSam system protein B [Nitrospirae bacterium]|nr:MAG: AmmeMemoRadiSam system protein B [Nitrospirota bacterium]